MNDIFKLTYLLHDINFNWCDNLFFNKYDLKYFESCYNKYSEDKKVAYNHCCNVIRIVRDFIYDNYTYKVHINAGVISFNTWFFSFGCTFNFILEDGKELNLYMKITPKHNLYRIEVIDD